MRRKSSAAAGGQRTERDAKSVQAKPKGHLHDIWQAETCVYAQTAFDFFVAT